MQPKPEDRKADLRDKAGKASADLTDTDTVAVEQGSQTKPSGPSIVKPGVGAQAEGQTTRG